MVYYGCGFSPSLVDMILSDIDPSATKANVCRTTFKRRIPIDVIETDSEFQVVADVPGAQKEAVHLDIDKDTLTISVPQPKAKTAAPSAATPGEPAETATEGEKTQEATVPASETKAEEPKVLHRERADGFAKRSVKLPETADLEQARAECADGILKVTFPKKALPGPKRITIV